MCGGVCGLGHWALRGGGEAHAHLRHSDAHLTRTCRTTCVFKQPIEVAFIEARWMSKNSTVITQHYPSAGVQHQYPTLQEPVGPPAGLFCSAPPLSPVCACRSSTPRSSTTCWRQQRATPRKARASSRTSPDTSSASWGSPETPWRVRGHQLSAGTL